MPVPLYHVDAFTTAPFRGNPAAVCVLSEPRDVAWMQSVAAEMNLSETAFPVRKREALYSLRWFTPKTEVPLCGHATLATAAVLFGERLVGEAHGVVTFDTASGALSVERVKGGELAMSLPAYESEPVASEDEWAIVRAAGVVASDVRFSRGAHKLLARVANEDEVRGASPDPSALLAAANPLGVRGLIVTSEATDGDQRADGAHFVSRYFAPWVGVPEDPVTGSAHCVLAPYWRSRLGRSKLRAAQLSERGGALGVELSADRVILSGACTIVARGSLLV